VRCLSTSILSCCVVVCRSRVVRERRTSCSAHDSSMLRPTRSILGESCSGLLGPFASRNEDGSDR
jgi:hypothetical protein